MSNMNTIFCILFLTPTAALRVTLPTADQNLDTDETPEARASPPSPFYLKHLSKAGGSFAHWVLDKVFIHSSAFTFLPDDVPLGRNSADHFVAITMRNPCDLYVSLAHFTPEKVFWGNRSLMGENPIPKQHGEQRPNLKPEELKQWLLNERAADQSKDSTTSSSGYYSHYLWTHLIAQECHAYEMCGKLCGCSCAKMSGPDQTKAARCADPAVKEKELREFDPKKKANCWIHTETAIDDLRTCFKLYESYRAQKRQSYRGNTFKDVIDWDMFESIANGTVKYAEKNSYAFQHSPEGSKHPACSSYDSSGDLSKLVRESDPYLFEKFGYQQCCQPPVRP